MTELKTLKDIKPRLHEPIFGCVRQEAIKWIKNFDNGVMFLPKEISVFFTTIPFHTYRIEGAIEILKYFFNITEDDLK